MAPSKENIASSRPPDSPGRRPEPADKLLRQSRGLFPFLESLPDPAFLVDRAGLILECSGGPPAERRDLIGKPFLSMVASDPGGLVHAALKDAFAPGLPHTVELTWRPNPSTFRRYLATFAPVGRDGSPVATLVITTDITARQREQERLTRSASLMNEIERVANVGVWTWDPKEPNAWWSPQLYQIYGLDPKTHTPTYQDYLTRVHADDRERVAKATEAVFRDFKAYSHDERIYRPDGSMRYLHTWAHAVLDDHGALSMLVGVCQDITDRKESEVVQERLAAIVASSEDAIIGKDLHGTITSWNKAAERMFGYTEAEVIGKSIRILLPPDLMGEEEQFLARLGRGERIESHETRRCAKDGRILDVVLFVSPIRDPEGSIVGASKIVRDVTERHASEERFRQLLEASPDALVVVDEVGRIVRVNKEAERLFGYEREEMLGQPVELLVPDGVRPRHAAYREQYMMDPQLRPMGIGRDLQARRKDGTEFPVEVSLNPLRTSQGTLVISAVRDITERRRIANEREELERLRAMDTFKGQFINMAAHELNTPLTPLKLQVHLLKAGSLGPLSEPQRRAADILDRNLERVAHLVQNMLDVGRIQSGRIELRKGPLDVNGAVEEAVDAFEDVAKQRGVHLEAWTSGDLWVEADAQRIHQVLFNLLSNAIKFTPTGGRILVEAETDHDKAIVHVRDTGAGLTPEQAVRLFRPFSQVHGHVQTAGQPGTGLGLYISRQLIELHGGHLTVDSPGPGQGSTFTFTLPGLIPARVPSRTTVPDPEDALRLPDQGPSPASLPESQPPLGEWWPA